MSPHSPQKPRESIKPKKSRELFTLAIDCGGNSIKGSVLNSAGVMHEVMMQQETPYPLTPQKLLTIIETFAENLPDFDRITIGMPGMIRHGIVVYTPHYSRKNGPHTEVDPEVEAQWRDFNLAGFVSGHFKRPTLVLNDAEVHAAGVIHGTGLEVVLTLGTGLGFATFDNGILAPHMEMSMAPTRGAKSFDLYIGEKVRKRIGNPMWSRRVLSMVEQLRPVFHWDRLYIGGGNSERISVTTRQRVGSDVYIMPNSTGVAGGARAWEIEKLSEVKSQVKSRVKSQVKSQVKKA